MAKAAEGGDYDHLSRIAEWAKLLNATLNGQPVTEPELMQPGAIPVPSSGNGVHPRPAALRDRSSATVTRKAKVLRRKKGAGANDKSRFPEVCP